jgi:hypothetical protein
LVGSVFLAPGASLSQRGEKAFMIEGSVEVRLAAFNPIHDVTDCARIFDA